MLRGSSNYWCSGADCVDISGCSGEDCGAEELARADIAQYHCDVIAHGLARRHAVPAVRYVPASPGRRGAAPRAPRDGRPAVPAVLRLHPRTRRFLHLYPGGNGQRLAGETLSASARPRRSFHARVRPAKPPGGGGVDRVECAPAGLTRPRTLALVAGAETWQRQRPCPPNWLRCPTRTDFHRIYNPFLRAARPPPAAGQAAPGGGMIGKRSTSPRWPLDDGLTASSPGSSASSAAGASSAADAIRFGVYNARDDGPGQRHEPSTATPSPDVLTPPGLE